MARVKGKNIERKRHKKILKLAKGFVAGRGRLYRTAKEAVMKALSYQYVGRKDRKQDFRRLWITRINTAARLHGLTYSKLMNLLKTANIEINRKILADLTVNDPIAFTNIIEQVKLKAS